LVVYKIIPSVIPSVTIAAIRQIIQLKCWIQD